jgi:hypothetical protein
MIGKLWLSFMRLSPLGKALAKHATRVPKWVCEKTAPNVVQIDTQLVPWKKVAQWFAQLLTFEKQQPYGNNGPKGENSPNLVTLHGTKQWLQLILNQTIPERLGYSRIFWMGGGIFRLILLSQWDLDFESGFGQNSDYVFSFSFWIRKMSENFDAEGAQL